MLKNWMRWISLTLAVVMLGGAVLMAVLLSPLQTVYAQTPLSLSWLGFYWDNRNFTGAPKISRTDGAISFNWASGSPDAALPADNFSARWSTKINVTTAGTFRFRAGADDGIRVAVDGNLVINRFTESASFALVETDVNIGVGVHEVIVDYFEGVGSAGVLFEIYPLTGQVNNAGVAPAAVPTTAVVAPIATPVPVVVKAVVIVNRANIRSGPGVNYPTIGQAFLDQKFKVLACNGPFGFETWFLLDLGDGTKGWMQRPVIYVYGGDPATLPVSKEEVAGASVAPASDGLGTFEVTGYTRTAVAVRTAPSTRFGEKMGVIERGQVIKILKLSTNRAWIFVDYNGLQGWVYLPNVRVTSGKLGTLPRTDS